MHAACCLPLPAGCWLLADSYWLLSMLLRFTPYRQWFLVDMEPVSKFDEIVSLDQLKENDSLDGMLVIKRGQRLSVQPVEKIHFDEVCKMANAKI